MVKRFSVVVGACIGICNAIACTPASRPLAVTQPKTTPAVVRHPTYPPDPEDKPQFVQRTGKTAAIELAPAEAKVVGQLRTAQATYLLIGAAHENQLSEAILDSVTDANGRPIVAAVAGKGASTQSLAAPVYELVVRLGGDLRLAKLTSLHWSSRGNRRSNPWQGGYRQALTLVGAESAPVRKSLEAEFGESMANWFELTAHQEPFAAFAAARIAHIAAKSSSPTSYHQDLAAPGRVELLDLMDFYTGRSAVNDSLQTQRGLQLNKGRQVNTEAIELLQPEPSEPHAKPAVPAHDSAQPCSGCSAVSAYLPANALVLEFETLKDLVHLPRLLDRRLGPLLRIAEASGGSSHLVERYRKQLAIELDGFAETVGQFAVKNAAVVLSDPYLREGTDVTLILKAENLTLLQGVLESHLQRAKREHPDLSTTQEKIEGQDVALHSTPDGRVRRFEFGFDDYRVLSNSRSVIARMIRIRQGLLPRLSQDVDYVAARSERAGRGNKERAWLYFGSGFVENLIGPRSKILEARRLRAKSELLAVDHAALLFGWMEGRRPANLTELLRSGWLESTDLVHFDGAPITWSTTWGAHSKWGFAQSLVPIVDLQIGKVSRNEASAYRAFRRRYEATMNGMLDPTMLRFARTTDDEDIRTELSIFPVPIGGRFNSEFRHVAELVGGGRIEPGRAASGLSASLAVGDGSPLRELFDTNVGGLFGNRQVTASFVGDWVKVGVDDGAAIWDVAAREHLIPTTGEPGDTAPGRFDIDRLIPRLPIWVAVHVRSRLLLTAAMTALRMKLSSSASDPVRWDQDVNYRGSQITRVRVQESSATNAVLANVYYAVTGDVLLVSLRRDILQARIDEVLAGRTPRGVPVSSDSTQLALDWAPKLEGWLQRTTQGMLDQAAVDAYERACVGLRVLALGYRAEAEPLEQRRSSAIRLLGYEPETPGGGELRWQNGQCEGGSYGTEVEPVVPDAQNATLLLHRILSSISELRVTLGMAPHEEAIELRARLQLSHGPSRSRP